MYHKDTKIIVTGGSGYVGRTLVDLLADQGHELTVLDRQVVVRQPGVTYRHVDLLADVIESSWFDGIDAIVHLAGVPLFGSLWTAAYRQEIYDSRVVTARRLNQAILLLPPERRPHTVVTARS